MKEQLKKIEELAVSELSSCTEIKALDDLRIKYLGKKGELTEILRGMKDLTPEERPVVGALVNTVRDEIENAISSADAPTTRLSNNLKAIGQTFKNTMSWQ